ncbi:hypothetical protein JCM8208_000485 [Rhodotorula glutinis]
MTAAAQAVPQPPAPSYPAPGTAFRDFSSLSTLIHSVHPTSPPSDPLTLASPDSPIAAANISPPELIERRRGAEVSWTCKLGTRKPGRRKAGERRKSVEELCGFRLSAVRQGTSSPSSASWVVTSFAPHVAAVHAQGWVASEAHDAAVRAGIAPPPPVVLPKRDGSGRFSRSRSAPSPATTRAELDEQPVEGEGGESGSPPPDTMRMKGGTLVPLVPLVPGPLGNERVKPVRPRRDREHVGDGAWEAWATSSAGRGEVGQDEERTRVRRKEERERIERMGGYGALRSWGWCEGLLEPMSDEEQLPVQDEVQHTAVADNPTLDRTALRRLVFEIVPSSFPLPPSPPPATSPTQPRKRSSATAGLAPGRGGKRSRRVLDPEWLPVLALRSQRSATRAVAVLEDIAETVVEEEEQGAGALELDGEEKEPRDESTFSSPDDLPPLRQSSPIIHFSSHHSSTLPIRSTVAAFTPFTLSSRRTSTASSTAPSLFSSPTASRETSFSRASTTTPDTSVVPSEGSPVPPTAAALPPPPRPLRPLRPRPPLVLTLAQPQPPPQQHAKKPKQRRSRATQPRTRRASLGEPGVHASASAAAAAEAHANAVEERSRLEDDAAWALVGMGRRDSVGQEGAAGGGALEPARAVGAAAGGGGAQLWEWEQWGV